MSLPFTEEEVGMAKHASRMETIKIHEKLKELLKPMGGNFWIYPDNMSDGSVAEELGVKKASVAGVRNECFGLLFRKAAPAKTSQLGELQLATRAVQSVVEEIRIKHNSLCMKFPDCQHLQVKPPHAGGIS